ncbi:hypothetical protein M427DRAFT_59565, partial [Gonapodya prolifera JEL478]
WNRAYLFWTSFPASVTYLNLDDEKTLSNLPWPESESARRTVWAASILDGGVNMTIGAGSGHLACGDTLGMVRLPSPECIWGSNIPPPQSFLTPPTLDALFSGLEDESIHPTSGASAVSTTGLSASLLSVLARSARLHRWCSSRGIFAFMPGDSRAAKKAARDVEDIERDLKSWRNTFELRVSIGGLDLPLRLCPP